MLVLPPHWKLRGAVFSYDINNFIEPHRPVEMEGKRCDKRPNFDFRVIIASPFLSESFMLSGEITSTEEYGSASLVCSCCVIAITVNFPVVE